MFVFCFFFRGRLFQEDCFFKGSDFFELPSLLKMAFKWHTGHRERFKHDYVSSFQQDADD